MGVNPPRRAAARACYNTAAMPEYSPELADRVRQHDPEALAQFLSERRQALQIGRN